MNFLLLSHGKSGKREIAVSLLVFWASLSGRHFMWIDAATHAAQNEAWSTLTWATFAFAAGAFGIDFMMKNGAFGGTSVAPRVSLRTKTTDADGPENHKGAI